MLVYLHRIIYQLIPQTNQHDESVEGTPSIPLNYLLQLHSG